MKQEREDQGRNAEQKRCREPTCWPYRRCRIPLVSVAELKTQARKRIFEAGKELKLHYPFYRGLRAREEMEVDERAIRENSSRWDGRGRRSLRSGTDKGAVRRPARGRP